MLLMLCVSVMAQSVTLTFTGKDANNNRVQLDRVSITNLTKGWQETIYWPDTTLTMQNGGTGIDDYANNGGFVLSQNNPNPFNGTTDVLLTVADAGAVTLEITDANGRMVVETTHALSLPTGTHQFRVSLSAAGTYVMTARQNGKMASIKMVNNGGGNANGIEYAGKIVETTHALSLQPKSDTRGNTNNPFNFGDQMEYVGYATINGVEYESERISQMQGASQTFALVFAVAQHTIPTVTTTAISDITTTSATVGGNVVSDGGENVFDRGICFSTGTMPTISDNCLHMGQGTGIFSDVLNGLQPDSTYYVRAFAINSIGVAYGTVVSFIVASANTFICGTSTLTDIDSNVYNTVQIGLQCWMKENLRTTRFADGTYIPLGGSESFTEPYRYAPSGGENTIVERGYLYNWAAMRYLTASAYHFQTQGICPDGWHVPDDNEWTQLTSYVGNQLEFRCNPINPSYIAKSIASTIGWSTCTYDCAVGNDVSANDATGFSALPVGGYYGGTGGYGSGAVFWSDRESNGNYAYYRGFTYASATIDRDFDRKSYGFSVRCLKD